MQTKTRSVVVLAATLAVACGPMVAPGPDAQGQDASSADAVLVSDATPVAVDASAESSVPDATAPDATAPDATAPDATAPDATVPDAMEPDAGPGTRAVASAARICGVAVVAGATNPRSQFTVAWAENHSTGENAVHVAQVDDSGALSNDHVVARGGQELCVTRGSLSSDGSVVVWARGDGATYPTIHGAVLDENAAPVTALTVPYARADSAVLTETNLVVERSGNTLTLAFETFLGIGPSIRVIEFDLATRAVPPAGSMPEAALTVDHPLTIDLPPSGYRIFLADGLVVFTRSTGRGETTVHGRRFYAGGWNGDEFAIPVTGTSPMPLALRGGNGSFELLFDAGVRDRSLYRMTVPRFAGDEVMPALVASNTAWNAADADLTAGRPDVLWTSHGASGGYNAAVMLAPTGQAEPHRCVAFRAGHEQGSFVALAHAQRASRNRLVAAVASVPEGRTARQTLFIRGVADGGTVCE